MRIERGRSEPPIANLPSPIANRRFNRQSTLADSIGTLQSAVGTVVLCPQPFPDLRWEAKDEAAGLAGVHGGRSKERIEAMLWKGFQRPKRLEFERETLTDR